MSERLTAKKLRQYHDALKKLSDPHAFQTYQTIIKIFDLTHPYTTDWHTWTMWLNELANASDPYEFLNNELNKLKDKNEKAS